MVTKNNIAHKEFIHTFYLENYYFRDQFMGEILNGLVLIINKLKTNYFSQSIHKQGNAILMFLFVQLFKHTT